MSGGYGGQIADPGLLGALPLRDHDRTRAPHERLVLLGARSKRDSGDPFEPIEFDDPATTYADIMGALLWEAGSRECGGWGFQSSATITGGAAGGKTKQRGAGGPGQVLPLRRQGEADDRFQPKSPRWPAGLVGFPGGWTLTMGAGSEEYSQEEIPHPDFLGLVDPNLAGDPQLGTVVWDLDAQNGLHPRRWARLQSAWSVQDMRGHRCGGGGPALALQLGPSRLDHVDGYLPMVDHGSGEVGYAAHERGGPLTLNGGACTHVAGQDPDGNTFRPVHAHIETLWSSAFGCAPMFFESSPWQRTVPDKKDGGLWHRVHLRLNREIHHLWCGGAYPGRWEWQVKVPLAIVFAEDDKGDPDEEGEGEDLISTGGTEGRPVTGTTGRPVTGTGGSPGGLVSTGSGTGLPVGDSPGELVVSPPGESPTAGEIQDVLDDIALPIGDLLPPGYDLPPRPSRPVTGSSSPGGRGTYAGETPLNDHAGLYEPAWAHGTNCTFFPCFGGIAYPTAEGEVALGGALAPTGEEIQGTLTSSPRPGNLTGIALGDGTSDGWSYVDIPACEWKGASEGGFLLHSPAVPTGEIMGGRYDPCRGGKTAAATSSIYVPAGVASLEFSHPRTGLRTLVACGGQIAQGADGEGVKIESRDDAGDLTGTKIEVKEDEVLVYGSAFKFNDVDVSPGSAGWYGVGGTGEDGAVTETGDASYGATMNFTTWDDGGYTVHPNANNPLAILATGTITHDGKFGTSGRGYVEPA